MSKQLKAEHNIAKTAEQIAAEIRRVANGMKALKDSKLSEKAIVILIAEATGVSRADVRKMLDQLDDLESIFLKKGAKV